MAGTFESGLEYALMKETFRLLSCFPCSIVGLN